MQINPLLFFSRAYIQHHHHQLKTTFFVLSAYSRRCLNDVVVGISSWMDRIITSVAACHSHCSSDNASSLLPFPALLTTTNTIHCSLQSLQERCCWCWCLKEHKIDKITRSKCGQSHVVLCCHYRCCNLVFGRRGNRRHMPEPRAKRGRTRY
jgi:hypothetical protein